LLTYRCTKKLLDRWRERPVEPSPTSTTRLGDWFGTLLFDKPRHLALFVAHRTLLPVVVEAAPIGRLAERHREGLREVLRALRIPAAAIEAELAEMEPVAFAKTNDRVRGGTMNDFIRMLPYGLGRAASLLEESLQLAKAPCGPIGMESPDDFTKEVFGVPRLRLV